MTIEKQHNGSILIDYISDNGDYHKMVYYDYTCSEAVHCFFEYLNDQCLNKKELKELRLNPDKWCLVGLSQEALEDEVHEYIENPDEDVGGFITCNGKGERV